MGIVIVPYGLTFDAVESYWSPSLSSRLTVILSHKRDWIFEPWLTGFMDAAVSLAHHSLLHSLTRY